MKISRKIKNPFVTQKDLGAPPRLDNINEAQAIFAKRTSAFYALMVGCSGFLFLEVVKIAVVLFCPNFYAWVLVNLHYYFIFLIVALAFTFGTFMLMKARVEVAFKNKGTNADHGHQ